MQYLGDLVSSTLKANMPDIALAQDLYKDVAELKNASKASMYCVGLKRKFARSKLEGIGSIANVAFGSLLTLSLAAYAGYKFSVEGYANIDQKATAAVVSGLGVVILLSKNKIKNEVVDNIIHGYYESVSGIVDKYIGSRLSAETKEQMKQQISAALENTPTDQIESVVLGILAKNIAQMY